MNNTDFFSMCFPNLYDKLDDETKRQVQTREYAFTFLEKICNLYDIKCDILDCESSDIIKYAFFNGHVGFCMIDGKLCCGIGTYVDEGAGLDRNGRLRNYRINFLNGETYTGEIDKDVIVLWFNNLAHGQSAFLSWYLNMLADTDVSMGYNIIYTRVCPIPVVETDVEKKSMEKVLDNLFNGTRKIFKRTTASGLFGDNVANRQNTLDLTNPQASTYMQNLSRFHDELILRICLEFGVYVSSRDKGSQMNNRELSAFADYCAITSDDTYNQFLKAFRKIKEIFGVDITCTPKAFVYTEKDVKADEDGEKNEESEGGDNDDNGIMENEE